MYVIHNKLCFSSLSCAHQEQDFSKNLGQSVK